MSNNSVLSGLNRPVNETTKQLCSIAAPQVALEINVIEMSFNINNFRQTGYFYRALWIEMLCSTKNML